MRAPVLQARDAGEDADEGPVATVAAEGGRKKKKKDEEGGGSA